MIDLVYIIFWGKLGKFTLKTVLSKAQKLQPLGQTQSHSKDYFERGLPFSWYFRSATGSAFPFVPHQFTNLQPRKNMPKLQRQRVSEREDKKRIKAAKYGWKMIKTTQNGKMLIVRRSSQARDLMLIWVFCLFHTAFPEVLQPASSLEGALVGIGWRPNVL